MYCNYLFIDQSTADEPPIIAYILTVEGPPQLLCFRRSPLPPLIKVFSYMLKSSTTFSCISCLVLTPHMKIQMVQCLINSATDMVEDG